jgi:hypothetical protein
VSKVISGLQEEVHLVRSELRMVRSIIEDHRKESIDREKKRDMEHQLSTQRYEDFASKLLTILGSSERLSGHIPGNIYGTIPTGPFDDNSLPSRNTNNIAPLNVDNNYTISPNNQPTPYDSTNQFHPESIITGTSNTQSNISLLRATGVTALDQLLPSNRPLIPILEKQFPSSFREIYDEYQQKNLYRFEKNGSKNSFSTQQQSLFSKRYRAMRLVRSVAAKYKPPKAILEVITILDNDLRTSPLTMTNFLNKNYDIYCDHKKRKRE